MSNQNPFIRLDRGSAVPLYVQLASNLENSIKSGEIKNGSMPEGEVKLAERLRLSRPTVRKAIQLLVDKNLVHRARGIGTLVTGTKTDRHGYTSTTESNYPTIKGTLAVIVPDGENPFFSEISRAISTHAWQRGFFTVVADSQEHLETETQLIISAVRDLSGLILVSPRSDDNTILSSAYPSKTVLVNRSLSGFSSVMVDVSVGMEQAFSHLVALGHSRICYVGGPSNSRSDQIIQRTLEESAKKTESDFKLLTRVAPTLTGGYSAGDLVLASKCTAAITHNDLVAMGILQRISERGVSVPGDMSIIGTDDTPYSRILSPKLSTVAISKTAVALNALDLLIRKIGFATEKSETIKVASQLIVRESSAEPKPIFSN